MSKWEIKLFTEKKKKKAGGERKKKTKKTTPSWVMLGQALGQELGGQMWSITRAPAPRWGCGVPSTGQDGCACSAPRLSLSGFLFPGAG